MNRISFFGNAVNQKSRNGTVHGERGDQDGTLSAL